MMQRDYRDCVKKLREKHDAEIESLETRKIVRQAHVLHERNRKRMLLIYKQRKIEKRGRVAEDKERVWAQRSALQTRTATRAVTKKGTAEPGVFGTNTELTTIQLPPLELDPSPRRRTPARPPANQ
jgi:hypothetical protein